MLTFGGFLLLSGRLGDLYGHRKLFLIGLVMFTLASLSCGLSNTQTLLIISRVIQGIGGAIVAAIGLSLLVDLFPEPAERAKAMGFFGFVASGGGSLGVLLGGLLTGALNWHWIFLVNIPIGILVFILSMKLLPSSVSRVIKERHLDYWGAVTVTSALMLAVYAIVNGNQVGFASAETIILLIIAGVLLGIFIFIESRARVPLIPLSMFRLRNVATANTVGVLWAAAMFAWFFISALYLQIVLGFSPMRVGLAFLPANLIMAIFSFSLSAKLVMHFGFKRPLAVGLTLAALGLLLLALVPVSGHYLLNVFPSMILLGMGAGMAFNPMLLSAMSDVSPSDSGLASGLVNTSFMMGGALGLSILASLAAVQTIQLKAAGVSELAALTGGYRVAFLVGAIFAGLGALLCALLLRARPTPQMDAPIH